ncbi:hypothetical protein O9X98_04725 [Agrobacterium salinitolerans]|nr:hypothetical protein [Agrobacterium salinitolerans]
MKVNIPFVYQVNYKMPRQPSWKDSPILSDAPVEIEDIAADDAPIIHIVSDSSARVSGGYREQDTVSKFHVPGGECVIRKHAGQFYASRFPVEEIANWRGNQEFDPFDVEIRLVAGDSEFRSKLRTDIGVRNMTLEEFHSKMGEVKKFTSDRPMVDRYINLLATRFAVIDGTLYEKVREPVLSVVVKPTGAVSVYIEEAISPTLTRFQKGAWRGTANERVRFGLDEYDRAVALATRWSSQLNVPLNVHAQVAHVSPSEVRFRGDHEYLFSAACGLAGQLRKGVSYMTEAAGHAVLAAANLLAVHNRLTPSSLSAVRKMEIELRKYFSEDFIQPPMYVDYDNSQAFEGWKWKLNRLSDAIANWDARDDIGLEWLDRSLDALPVYDYPRRAYEATSLTDLDKVALRWEGGLPIALAMADPETSAIVIVEDFEEFKPLAALVYDRNDRTLAPQVFGNPNPETVASEAALADAFVQSAKVEAANSMSLSGPAASSFRP